MSKSIRISDIELQSLHERFIEDKRIIRLNEEIHNVYNKSTALVKINEMGEMEYLYDKQTEAYVKSIREEIEIIKSTDYKELFQKL
tara:strand:+ start:686 stop:943 length:258 start_codon:yes stop_codon:yes gene_type:complete